MILLVAATGCRHQSAQPDELAQTKATFEQRLPGAKVGVVSETLPSSNLVAIQQVDLTQYYVGDTLVLMDENLKIIGAGTVVAKTNDALHVKYDVSEKGRAPKVGDIAVKPQQ